MALTYEDVVLGDGVIQIFTLPDRRPTSSSSLPIKWMYQMDLECVLYRDDNESRSTGAAYRLRTAHRMAYIGPILRGVQIVQ